MIFARGKVTCREYEYSKTNICDAIWIKEIVWGVLELYSRNLEKMTQGTKNAVHTNTAEQARLDISAKAEWTSFDKSFFDIRVTHPNCL